MKKKIPVALLCVLYLIFFGTLASTFSDLPNRVATHFAADGRPNGWMSRETHLLFMLGLATGLPGIVVGLCYVSRFLPVDLLNIPHRGYWTAPERRKSTYDFLFNHSFWFASLAVAFVTGIHLSILNANTKIPAELSMENLLVVAVGFLAGILVWALTLIRHFKNPPTANTLHFSANVG
ncbi:MAG TPA: DUF1648 domain-containing protein [Verrucomicrobiae bacterium]